MRLHVTLRLPGHGDRRQVDRAMEILLVRSFLRQETDTSRLHLFIGLKSALFAAAVAFAILYLHQLRPYHIRNNGRRRTVCSARGISPLVRQQ